MDLNITNTKVLTIQEIEDIQYLDGFSLTEKAYMDYISTIKDCSNINYEDAKKKIIRNLLLSNEAHTNRVEKHKRLYYYGNLSIGLNTREMSIYFIKNYIQTDYKFKLDIEKRRVLNVIMGIKEDK